MPANVLGWRTADYESRQIGDTYTPNAQVHFAGTAYGDIMVDQFWATNSDTVDHHLMVSASSGSDVWGVVTIPARAGYDGTVPVNILAAIWPNSTFPVIWGNENGPSWPWVALDATPGAGTFVCVNFLGGFC